MITAEISFDPNRIDYVAAARLLENTYWGVGRTEGNQLTAFANSVCAAAIHDGKQIGFGRAVTDRALIAHLCDIIVWPDFRGQGIGKQIIEAFLNNPELSGVSTWTLNTRDAHALYERYGFERSADGNTMRLSRSR